MLGSVWIWAAAVVHHVHMRLEVNCVFHCTRSTKGCFLCRVHKVTRCCIADLVFAAVSGSCGTCQHVVASAKKRSRFDCCSTAVGTNTAPLCCCSARPFQQPLHTRDDCTHNDAGKTSGCCAAVAPQPGRHMLHLIEAT